MNTLTILLGVAVFLALLVFSVWRFANVIAKELESERRQEEKENAKRW